MSIYKRDTIAALATPYGVGAMAVIRISGLDLKPVFKKLSGIGVIKPRYANFVNLKSLVSNNTLDQCILTYFEGPKSFTGEDVIEISCHGGDYVPKSILNDLYAFGIRPANPGEFSLRAYMNKKIDLVQAESISSIISSKTKIGTDANLLNISGELSNNLSIVKEKLIYLLTILEHELDFSETEISFIPDAVVLENLRVVSNSLKKTLKTAVLGKIISRGVRVVLLGRPNVGKSLLFNVLLGHERALVSDIAGTTRDVIEAWFDLDGLPVCLVDTAGYWNSENHLESLGIEKTKIEIDRADVVLFLDDVNPKDEFSLISKEIHVDNVMFVKTKQDFKPLLTHNDNLLFVSSVKNVGIDLLLTELSTRIHGIYSNNVSDSEPVLISLRQRVLVGEASSLLDNIIKVYLSGVSVDIVSSELREALLVLDQVLGLVTNEDILDNIFSGFCVGK